MNYSVIPVCTSATAFEYMAYISNKLISYYHAEKVTYIIAQDDFRSIQ